MQFITVPVVIFSDPQNSLKAKFLFIMYFLPFRKLYTQSVFSIFIVLNQVNQKQKNKTKKKKHGFLN